MMYLNLRALLPIFCVMALLCSTAQAAQENQTRLISPRFAVSAAVGLGVGGVVLIKYARPFLNRQLARLGCYIDSLVKEKKKRDNRAAVEHMTGSSQEIENMLCKAVRHGQAEIIDELHRRGAALAGHIIRLDDVLFRARGNGHTEVVRSLLQAMINEGVDVNTREKEGTKSLLDYAAVCGLEDIAHSLIQAGALVNARNDYFCGGETALHWAAQSGHEGVVRILLEHGAEVDAADRVIIDISTSRDSHEDLEYWITGGRRVLTRTLRYVREGQSECTTPLHYASLGNHEAVIRLLIEHGADVNRTAGRSVATPLHCAMLGKKNQTPESRARVGRLLVRAGAALTPELIPAMRNISPETPEGKRVLSYDLELYRELAQLRDQRVRAVRTALHDGMGVPIGPVRLIMEMEQPAAHIQHLRRLERWV